MCFFCSPLRFTFLATIWLGLLATGCDKPQTQTPDAPLATSAPERPVLDSHSRMLETLEQIKAHAFDPGQSFFFSEQPKKVEENLFPYAFSSPDIRAFHTNRVHGAEHLLLGRNTEAVDNFDRAYQLLPKVRASLTTEDLQDFLLNCGVAHLRLGERQNCVNCQTGDSCILPIRAAGIHKKRAGSTVAIRHFLELLAINPNHITARWLLNVASMTLGEYPQGVPSKFLIPPEKFRSEEEFPRFRNVAGKLGLNLVELAGSVIIDDFNGDGLMDIVTTTQNPAGEMHFFRNTGAGEFVDGTKDAGLTGLYGGLNLIQADYDNDGDLDILVLRGGWLKKVFGRHPSSLLRNDGRGHFRDVTFDAGLGNVHYPTQTASWADYDHDGDLDLFVGNEEFPCQLFKNNGNGTFTDVAAQAGVTNDSRYTKAVIFGDYDNDRYPDIYVSTMLGPNRLYHNERNGTFRDVAPELGVAEPHKSFPCWFFDVNNDGWLDIYVSRYNNNMESVARSFLGLPAQGEPDALYISNARGGFSNRGREMGINRLTAPMGSNFGDLDNDGYPDFYLGTGYPGYEGLMPNIMYHNHEGKKFVDVTMAGGFGHLQKGHGIAFADLDGDGDQDIYSHMGSAFLGDYSPSVVYENPGFGNHWLQVRLIGTKSDRFGVGARLRAEITEKGKTRTVYQWVNSGGTFGANPLQPHLGLGSATRIDRLEVYWPTSDTTQTFRDVPVDCRIKITEGEKVYQPFPAKKIPFRYRDTPEPKEEVLLNSLASPPVDAKTKP